MHRICLLPAICALGLAVGCNNASSKTGAGNGEKSKPAQTGPWKADYTTVVGSWDDLQNLIKSHNGKVVVVDFWTNWCAPCKKELPNLANLQKKYGDKIVCIAASLNYDGMNTVQEARTSADKELRSRFGTVLKPDEKLEAFIGFVANQADEDVYSGAGLDSVPTVLVFDKTGNRTKIDVNSARKNRGDKAEPSYELDVIPVVEKYLN